MNRFIPAFLVTLWMADILLMIIFSPLGKHVYGFGVLYLSGFILMLLMTHHFPSSWRSNNTLVVIFLLGLAARIAFLAYPHGNDIYRYIWEGHIQNQGFNPYAVAPESPLVTDAAAGDLKTIWQGINHKEFTAAYPPFTLLLFRFLARISIQPLFFKFVMLLFDTGTMVVLAMIIKARKLPPSRLLLYAANPMVILYIAGEGHLDSIQVFFLCLGIYLLLRRHAFSGLLSMGMAFVTKFFAAVAAPFWVRTENLKGLPAFFLPLLLYLPFLGAGDGIFNSLITFGATMHYNDSIALLFRSLFPDLAPAMLLGFFVMCLIWIYLTVPDPLHASYLAIGTLLLLLPTLHPWYLVLIAPFLVFFPSKAWIYLQAAVVFTFPVAAMEIKTGIFQEIPWLKLFEYVPFYSLLAFGFLRPDWGHLFSEKKFQPVKRISVIIPTLNEADVIGTCLKNLRNRTGVKEIVVADGGSNDATCEIAAEYGAAVVHTEKGRGIQIKKGIEIINGDVVFILHADCVAYQGVFNRILNSLNDNAQTVGGAFGMRFDTRGCKTGLISCLNNIRTFCTGIAFGDQGQFFRREVIRHMGSFPELMLMEDVELSMRLKEIGRVIYLRNGIEVSGRRWHNRQFATSFFTVLRLFARYLLSRRFHRPDQSARKYYRIYYS